MWLLYASQHIYIYMYLCIYKTGSVKIPSPRMLESCLCLVLMGDPSKSADVCLSKGVWGKGQAQVMKLVPTLLFLEQVCRSKN